MLVVFDTPTAVAWLMLLLLFLLCIAFGTLLAYICLLWKLHGLMQQWTEGKWEQKMPLLQDIRCFLRQYRTGWSWRKLNGKEQE